MTDILAAIATGLAQACSWPAFGFLLLGIAIGSIVGLLPGLGGTAMLAMLLPFTLGLSPLSTFALLVGAVAVLSTTGDLSSILLGVPGESISAAVVIDGHAMARRGEGGRAMGAALASSLVGAIFGAIVLALAIPVARPLLLSIGSPELFMLSVVGITFIAPLVGAAPLKGLIAGAFGFWLATIGLDPMDAEPRYTFGSLFLWDGVGLLPVVLGLFAIPEALVLASGAGRSTRAHVTAPVGGVAEGVRDVIRHWRLVLRCSAIGSYVGMMPGVGGSVAQWIAYAHARGGRTNTTSEGRRGAVEGVIGPGAANNSTLGGALIPTLMFGIPGSVTSVVLLSALIMKGIVPGTTVLQPESQGGHLGFVFSLVAFLVIANVIVVAAFLGLLAPLGRVASIRGTLLFPGVIVLVFIGAFMEKNAIEDLLVVAAAGALGWAMVRLDWPRPPLLLGLALGPLAENRLFLSTSLYGWSWWQRPGVLIIGVVAAVALWRALADRRMALRMRASASSVEREHGPAEHRHRTEGRAFLGLLLVTSALALAGTWSFGARAAVFPRLALVTMLVLSIAELASAIRRGTVALPDVDHVDVSAVLWAGAFLAAVWFGGFSIGAPAMVFLYLRVGGREGWITASLQAAAIAAFVEGVLKHLLAIPLSDGALIHLLAR